MDDLCIQNSHPLASCEFENRVVKYIIWHQASLSCSTGVSLKSSFEGVSLQSSFKNFQSYQDNYKLELHESKD